MPDASEPDEFWRLDRVKSVSGLSKTTIYRRIKARTFPASRPYRGSDGVFWLASEIRDWQGRELAEGR